MGDKYDKYQWVYTWITREKRQKGKDRWMFTGRKFEDPFDKVDFMEWAQRFVDEHKCMYKKVARDLLHIVDVVEEFYPSDADEGRYEEFYLTIYDYHLKQRGSKNTIMRWRQQACDCGLLKCTNAYWAKWKCSKAYIYNPVIGEYLCDLVEDRWHIMDGKLTPKEEWKVAKREKIKQWQKEHKEELDAKRRAREAQKKGKMDEFIDFVEEPRGIFTGAVMDKDIFTPLPKVSPLFAQKSKKVQKNMILRALQVIDWMVQIGGERREFCLVPESRRCFSIKELLRWGVAIETSTSHRPGNRKGYVINTSVKDELQNLLKSWD